MKIDGVNLVEGDRVLLTNQPRRRGLFDRVLRRRGRSNDGIWVVVGIIAPPTSEVPDSHCLLSYHEEHLPHLAEDPSWGWFHCDGTHLSRGFWITHVGGWRR